MKKRNMVLAGAACLLLAALIAVVSLAPGKSAMAETPKDTLIVYFDYSENMGDTTGWDLDAITSASLAGEHGIERGNLLVMRDVLTETVDADVYAIRVTEPYAPGFDAMADPAHEDIANDRQFEFVEPIPDVSGYSTVYIGMPVWWYGLPQPATCFLERVDLSDKNVVYFGIHRGSGDGGNPWTIQEMYENVNLLGSFTVEARTDNEKTRADFIEFLNGLNQ